MYPKIDLNKIKGNVLGRGTEKLCYRHALNPNRCLKISQKSLCKQTKREIEYYKFLKKRNIKASFIPEFYGEFEGNEYIGFEQECFIEKKEGGQYDSVLHLTDYILDPSSDLLEIEHMLNNLKTEMIQKNVIVSDLHGRNIFRVEKNSFVRLVVVDGYGSPEIIPYPQYIRFFGKLKIERQWKKLMKRLDPIFKQKSQFKGS